MATTQTTPSPDTPTPTDRPDIPITPEIERALTNPMLTIPYLDELRDAPGMYAVITTGEPYTVDLHLEACTCKAFKFHNGPCKHIHRARFATGQAPIPAGIPDNEIDTILGALCNSNEK